MLTIKQFVSDSITQIALGLIDANNSGIKKKI
jgi:hypothetical protein